MKLASIKPANPSSISEERDGRLVVVAGDALSVGILPKEPYSSLMSALEDWGRAEPFLREVAADLNAGIWPDSVAIEQVQFKSPLPRSYAFLDGSAFLEHVRRARRARNAPLPDNLESDPLMYQGLSDGFLDPDSDISILNSEFGVDFESEIGVILSGAKLGCDLVDAEQSIALVTILNDISLRGLIPSEIAKQFGFVQSKPASSFAPFAVTKDELGSAWADGRASIHVRTKLNGELVGDISGAEMHFSFMDLIAHAARTRNLSPGTIIGSGTVSSSSDENGVGCLVEKRVLETLQTGQATTPFLKHGDLVEIEGRLEGESLFGSIRQVCRAVDIKP